MKHQIQTLLILAATWFALACSEDTEQQPPVPDQPETPVEPQPSGGEVLQVAAVTRAGESVPMSNEAKGDIRLFLNATTGATYYEGTLPYNSTTDTWSSLASVVIGQPYRFYGYMPSSPDDVVSLAYLSGASNYESGAVLTHGGLTAVSTKDFCVITGVGSTADDPSTPVKGSYAFKASSGAKVTLLLSHVYARVDFKFAIGASYQELRDIRLKRVALETVDLVSSSITMQTDATTPFVFNTVAGTTKGECPIFTNETDSLLTSTASETTVTGYFAPALMGQLSLATIYEVLDKKGVVLRTDTASNKITFPSTVTLGPGDLYQFNLTVEPTYLFQLSDNDLNNPTITINAATP